MKKTAIAAALMMVAGVANAAPITSIELTGGTFSMDGTNFFNVSPGEFANMTVGGYDGGARTAADLAVNSIGYFEFGTFGPVLTSTQNDPLANGSDYAPVTGDITNDVLTLDLDAWTAWYNGEFFNQGTNDVCLDKSGFGDIVCSSGAAVTTYDAATGAFTATWDSVIVGGSFNGNLGQWTMTGNVSAVPVPAAVWLFGSGLVGLAGIARRRKAA